MNTSRLKIAIQKSGRLSNDSMDLLLRCGLQIKTSAKILFNYCENMPIDILMVRDNDIPTFVRDGVCDLGIIGENVLLEQSMADKNKEDGWHIIRKLAFSCCRLSIALPKGKMFEGATSLEGLRIATSYPNLLKDYLERNGIKAEVMTISGSVEIAPRLGLADGICDLVATGRTLEENYLQEVYPVFSSQAVLIKTRKDLNQENIDVIELLLRRMEGVIKARESKYIMFHIPKSALPSVIAILPGAETPTVMNLEGDRDKVAVHVVSSEGVFWDTLEKLKTAGASSILVLPIEKMLD
jgi:ATP phosphoribosyltransferase